MKNKIIVVFSSHLGNEKNDEFINHIYKTIGNIKFDVVCYPNYDQYSLSEVYNKAIDDHYTSDCIMLFAHPDILIKTPNWGKILLNHFNYSDYAILGLAGSVFVGNDGVWYSDRSKMCGIVSHTNGVSTWVSEYSNKFNGIKPTINVDGLFMAVDPDKIVKRFNLNYGKFHFYDLSFCLDNYLEDCNIGVITSISVLHKSIGQTNQSWEDNRKKFAEEHKDKLPIRHVPGDKLRVLICCQFLKNYTGSEMSNYELSKELVKLGCDVTIISSMIGEPLLSKAKKNGVKVFTYNNLPNYVLDQEGKFHFTKNEAEFDIIHINHKPIGELILGLYPNTPAVMHVRSEVIPVYEEPIINSIIKRYISIRDSVTEYIKTFGIAEDKIVLINNPFDIKRFNTNYKRVTNEKEIVLFIGTLDHLRKNILLDLVEMTKINNQELWIIGTRSVNLEMIDIERHVKYLGVKANVEKYIKMCDYTAGIFKGRTTIEGFLCGKPGWIYVVDNQGNIQNKTLAEAPEASELEKYSSDFSARQLFRLYEEVIDEAWL
jgi:glycosyltransferase involved in cell wall biosynthesis